MLDKGPIDLGHALWPTPADLLQGTPRLLTVDVVWRQTGEAGRVYGDEQERSGFGREVSRNRENFAAA